MTPAPEGTRPCPHLGPERPDPCPTESELADYLENRLPAIRAQVLAHALDRCVRCRGLLEELMEDAPAQPPEVGELLGSAQAAVHVALAPGASVAWSGLEAAVGEALHGFVVPAEDARSAMLVVPVGTGLPSTPGLPLHPRIMERLVDILRHEAGAQGLLRGARLHLAVGRGAAAARPFGIAVDVAVGAGEAPWTLRGAGLWVSPEVREALGPSTRGAASEEREGWTRLTPLSGPAAEELEIPSRGVGASGGRAVVHRGAEAPSAPWWRGALGLALAAVILLILLWLALR